MAKLRDSPDDLFALVGEASDHFGIRQEFVEKDYWVTELLRSIAKPLDGATLVFKGGTSLSKAFGLIERFSEDIDILVVPNPEFGLQRVHRLLKNVCERAGTDLEIASEDQRIRGSKTGIHRDVRYLYPTRLPSAILTEGVLLEMGRRGGDLPRERRTLRSMIASYAIDSGVAREDEYDDFALFEIDVLAPERTLVEKLALLHRLGVKDEGHELVRNGRHLYDVYKLLTAESVTTKLRTDPGTVARLANDADEQSAKWDMPFEPRPERGYVESPAFDVAGVPASSLRQGLQAATTLIYGVVPSFEDCIEVIRASADLL